MVFKSADPNAAKAPPDDLMAEAEKLVTKLVRTARSGRVVKDAATGKTRRVQYDVMDQARAIEAAMKFLQVKNKIQPETEEAEFDEQLREFHGQGGGGADTAETPTNGRAAATD